MRLPLYQPGAPYRAARIVRISGVDIYAGEIIPRAEVDDGCMRNLYESRIVDLAEEAAPPAEPAEPAAQRRKRK